MSDWLTRLLFEDLSLLLLAEAMTLAVVVGLHRRYMTPRSRRTVWITLAVCCGQIVMQKLVVTDREAIRAMVEAMANAVQQGDVAALADHFAEDLQFEKDRDKEAVVQHAREILQRYEIHNARVSGFRIDVSEDDATATFQAMADVRNGSAEMSYNTPTRWDLKCRRESDGWRVYRAKYEIGLGGLRF